MVCEIILSIFFLIFRAINMILISIIMGTSIYYVFCALFLLIVFYFIAYKREPATRVAGESAQGPLHGGLAVLGDRQVGHVGHGDDDAHLGQGASLVGNDRYWAGAAQEARDLLAWGDGGRQPDALRWAGQEVIKAIQGQRQVGAALLPGDGVDLIDDDGLHRLQGAAHLAGEHEVEGLRRRDEDIRSKVPPCGWCHFSSADRDPPGS